MKYSVEYWNDIDLVVKQVPNIDKLNRKTVLLTGATGMICSAVADILLWLKAQRDFELKLVFAGRSRSRMIERFAGFEEGKDFRFVTFDTTRPTQLDESPDFIIHGASNANPTMYRTQPVETLMGNLLGTDTLLQLAKRTSGSRLLFVSSSEVYGQNKGNLPYKESDYGFVDILSPRSAYPSGKRAVETLCASYASEHQVDSVIVRPGHIYGPTITKSDSRASAEFTRDVLNHQDIIMKSDGTQLRSYCYVLDCASAILSVLLNGKSGEAYNISNSESVVTVRQMAEALAEAGNVQIQFKNPTNAEKQGFNTMSKSSLDATRLENLGWQACFSLRTGSQHTIAQMK